MWAKEHQEKANTEGWRLVTTFDNGSITPLWDVACHGPRFDSDRVATQAVIEAAKQRSGLHQLALQLVMQSRQGPK